MNLLSSQVQLRTKIIWFWTGIFEKITFEESKYLQDKDRDGLISYEEFCDKKTKTEIAFEV